MFSKLRNWGPRGLMGLILVVGLSGWAWGALKPLTLEQITERAELIVVGKVTRLSDGYFRDLPGTGRVVFTDVTVRIEETWKGQWSSRDVTLQVPGGKLPDGRRVEAGEAPHFESGERVLVFMRNWHAMNWVYGWAQGKYHVQKKRVVGQPGYPVSQDTMTYALERRIKAILEKGE